MIMRPNTSVMAVPQLTAPAGLITWWKLGGTYSLHDLSTQWRASGFDQEGLPYPTPPSAATALRRALKQMFDKPNVKIQNLPNGGFAIVDISYKPSDEARADPVYAPRFKVWLEDDMLRVSKNASVEQLAPIWREWQAQQAQLLPNDISSWLITLADIHSAVRLREGGGVYFIPEARASRWRAISALIHAVSPVTAVYDVPAMCTESAVEAILDALKAEAEASMVSLRADLDNADLGSRALRTRRDACAAMISKVETYEKLLGQKLTDLQSALGSLEADFVEASLRE